MPGFFEGMRRMLVGEPIFKPDEHTDDPIYKKPLNDSPVEERQAVADNADMSVHEDKLNPPEAVIERFECHYHDDTHMDVNVHVRNLSKELLWIDKLMLFGQRYNLDHELDPGESREFMVYRGPMLDNKYYTNAELHYRTPNGDYFSAQHNIEFEERPNHKYIPHRMRFYGPVKDI
jgi:hypothetical protein